jgi:hypothetical protein
VTAPSSLRSPRRAAFLLAAGLLGAGFFLPHPTNAQGYPQWTPTAPGSDNVEVISHLPLGPRLSVADIEIEQELDRPYAYVARMVYGDIGPKGMDIIDLSDERDPEVLYRWRIENQELHQRTGGMDVKYFKVDGRYYVVQSLQFGQGGPNSDLGAVVLDVTGLPGYFDGAGGGPDPRARDSRGIPQHLHLQALERGRVPLHDRLRPGGERVRPATGRER